MKYETTRPVSAQLASRRHSSSQLIERPTNGIAKDKVFLTLSSEDGDNNKSDIVEDLESVDHETETERTSEVFKFQPEKPYIDVKIKRPQHVDAFVNDLKIMEKMEDDFRVKLDALQKKLGIAEGVI